MDIPTPVLLRSPRESLGGYILLPRLIDKVRLLAQGQLPPTCRQCPWNRVHAGRTVSDLYWVECRGVAPSDFVQPHR